VIAAQVKRLAKHSVVYGLGGIVSRLLAVFLLPLYTHYLGPEGFGKIETIVALTTVLVIVLQLGIGSAFFRFYFDTKDPRQRVLVVRTAFWFTMGMATLGLVVGWVLATPIAHALALGDDPRLVRAGFVGLWAQLNYQQLTALFRVEERSTQFAIASVANVLLTIGVTVLLVVGLHKGPTGAVVGNFVGTLAVYLVLLAYRRYQLGFQFDRTLLRQMNRFGLPLVPSALALWAINLIDRLFIAHYKGQAEVGVYSVAVRISSAVAFLLVAFRLAWPAFAYSIDDDREAKRTYSYVLTYLLFICSWLSLALGVLSPWLVRLLARGPGFERAHEAVALLAFGATAYAGYTVLAIGIGRARQTQYNWIVSGLAAAINIGLNVALIPPYGMIGAAVSTLVAYVALFVVMWLNARRVYPVAYQWRRVLTLVSVAVGLTALGEALAVPLPVAVLLVLVYPLALLPLGFYLPAERTRLRRLVRVPSL
jgi:O-antigen/teichoic acid export membrane protein